MSNPKFPLLQKGQPFWDQHMNQIIEDLNIDLQYGKDLVIIDNNKNSTIDTSSLNKPSIPSVNIKGRHLINLMGNRGNALYRRYYEFKATNCTISELDDTRTVNFQATIADGVIAVIDTSTIDDINTNIVNGKYYIALAEVNAPEASNIAVDITGSTTFTSGNVNIDGPVKLVYCVSKITTDTNYLNIRIANATSYKTINAYFNKIRIYEISEEEANDVKNGNIDVSRIYQYVDNEKGVVNPYITAIENLMEYNKFTIGSVAPNGNYQGDNDINHITSVSYISLEPNTDYTLSVENNSDIDLISNDINVYARVYDRHDTDWSLNELNELLSDSITFRTKKEKHNNIFRVYIQPNTGDDTLNELLSAEIMTAIRSGLIKFVLTKTSSPVKSESCQNSRISFETTIRDDETIRIVQGYYMKNSIWEEIIIDGSHKMSVVDKFDGYKIIKFDDITYSTNTSEDTSVDKNNFILVRYDGKIIKHADSSATWKTSGDKFRFADADVEENNKLTIIVPNALSGWGNDYTPTEDEIKAYFLGWIMYEDEPGNNKLYNDPTNTTNKTWCKQWCGIGVRSTSGVTTNIGISGTGVHELPRVKNEQGYTPYRIIFKRNRYKSEIVNTYGILMISDRTNIAVESGLVMNEMYRVSHYSIPYFNLSYDVSNSLTKHRVNEILSIECNRDKVDYDTLLHNSETSIVNGKVFGRLYHPFYNEDISVDYLIYDVDTLTSYDVSFDVSDTTHDDIKKLINRNRTLFNEYHMLKNELIKVRNVSNPNLLINGNFRIWQRGTEITSNEQTPLKFCADRWRMSDYSETFNIVARKIDDGGIEITTDNVNDIFEISQTIPIEKTLWGKDITLSCDGNPSSMHIIFMNDVTIPYNTENRTPKDNFGNGNKHITAKVPYGTKSIAVLLQSREKLSMKIRWVKLEVGRYPTTFIPKQYNEELRDCKYYYQEFVNFPLLAVCNTNNFRVCLPVDEMRVPPLPSMDVLNESNYYTMKSNGVNTVINSINSITTNRITGGIALTVYTSIVLTEHNNSAALLAMYGSPKIYLDAEIY